MAGARDFPGTGQTAPVSWTHHPYCYNLGMTRTHLMPVLLCALLPLQALGQASPPPLLPASEEPVSESQGEPLPPGVLSPAQEKAKTSRRTTEALAGVLLGAAGAAPGIVMMARSRLCVSSDCDDSRSGLFFKGLGIGFVGFTAGAALGVTVGGAGEGGEGGFLPAAGGALLGALVGAGCGLGTLLLTIVASIASEGLATAMLFVAVPLAVTVPIVVGAVSLYESAHARAVAKKQEASARLQVVHVLSVSPSGGLLAGLAGRF